MFKLPTAMLLLELSALVSAGSAAAATCGRAVLDGPRSNVFNCFDSTCGIYDVLTLVDRGFGGASPDTIAFNFNSADASPPDTGTFVLGTGVNSNTSTCLQCIVVSEDVGDNGPAKYLFPTAGTLTIDAKTVPGVDSQLNLTWSGVTVAEVTIDPDTRVSTPVPDGECYTIVQDPIFAGGFEGQ